MLHLSKTAGDSAFAAASPESLSRATTAQHYAVLIALVAVAYFLGGRLGLALAFSAKHVSAVWPPAGIALAALFLLGNRLWPGVFLAALLISVLGGQPLLVAGCIAAGNTATALIGAIALRTLRFDAALERGSDVVSLFGVAICSTLVSATLGAAILRAGSIIAPNEYSSIWWLWWTGDSLGVLIAAPLIFAWAGRPRLIRSVAVLCEFGAYLAATIFIGLAVFVLPSGESASFYPRAYVAFPLLAWAGLRLGTRETALGVAVISMLAIWGSFHGHGPFSRWGLDSRYIMLDAFLATLGCTAVLVAAVIAERQGARVAARESAGLLEAIVEHTPALIYVKDLQGRFLMANRRFADLSQMAPAALRGKTDFDVFGREDAERFRALDARVVRAGSALTEEEVMARGAERHAYVSVKFPLRNDAGQTFAVVGISTEITELHRAQARLREAYDELEVRVRERTADLAAAVDELGKRNQEKEVLLREIHHRVKNNLQVVSGLLTLQAQGHEDAGLRAFAADCIARVRSMALVHEHLYQSKNLQGVPFATYVGALAHELVHAQRVAGNVEVTLEIADSVSLPIDQAIPCGLLVNELVTNALKHAFPDGRAGRVSVSIGPQEPGSIQLLVSDDGVGMAQTVSVPGQCGFGLTLVTMLIDQLQATLEIERGQGTRVRVRFPSARL